MTKMSLPKLPDRAPVKLTITVAPDLAARLRAYADLYAETYGVREEPAELVPYMLESFLKADTGFRRASRAKGNNAAAEGQSRMPSIGQTPVDLEFGIRDLLRKPHAMGRRSDTSER